MARATVELYLPASPGGPRRRVSLRVEARNVEPARELLRDYGAHMARGERPALGQLATRHSVPPSTALRWLVETGSYRAPSTVETKRARARSLYTSMPLASITRVAEFMGETPGRVRGWLTRPTNILRSRASSPRGGRTARAEARRPESWDMVCNRGLSTAAAAELLGVDVSTVCADLRHPDNPYPWPLPKSHPARSAAPRSSDA